MCNEPICDLCCHGKDDLECKAALKQRLQEEKEKENKIRLHFENLDSKIYKITTEIDQFHAHPYTGRRQRPEAGRRRRTQRILKTRRTSTGPGPFSSRGAGRRTGRSRRSNGHTHGTPSSRVRTSS